MMPISVHTSPNGKRAEVVTTGSGRYSVLFYDKDTWTHETNAMALHEAVNLAKLYTQNVGGNQLLID